VDKAGDMRIRENSTTMAPEKKDSFLKKDALIVLVFCEEYVEFPL
jgi:hypothetical protein